MTEEEATSKLSAYLASKGHDADRLVNFVAERKEAEKAWVFTWDVSSGKLNMPLGEPAWVVFDNGKVTPMTWRQKLEDVK